MFSRLSQLSRHLPSAQAISKAIKPAASVHGLARRIMVSADERNTRNIHTAACLIIGDEVLGGKVRSSPGCVELLQLTDSWFPQTVDVSAARRPEIGEGEKVRRRTNPLARPTRPTWPSGASTWALYVEIRNSCDSLILIGTRI